MRENPFIFLVLVVSGFKAAQDLSAPRFLFNPSSTPPFPTMSTSGLKAIAPVPTAADFLDIVLSKTQKKTPTVRPALNGHLCTAGSKSGISAMSGFAVTTLADVQGLDRMY